MEWQAVIRLVEQAGAILLDRAAAQTITVKGRADYVTQVDFAVQEFLKTELGALTPDLPLMSEEQDNRTLDFSQPLWILDPVDGTTNLIHGFPAKRRQLRAAGTGKSHPGGGVQPFPAGAVYRQGGARGVLQRRLHSGENPPPIWPTA